MKTLRKGIASLLSLVMTAALVGGSALAQGTTSRVVGNVLDPNGAAVPDATVTLTNEATKTSFTTNTTTAGTYVFDSVQGGSYTITVEKGGFKKFVTSDNVLSIGQPMTVNVTLELGQVAEVVEVRGGAELVQTSSSGNFGYIMDQRMIERLPIVGVRGRNPLDFVLLAPGVVNGANTGGGIHVHGARDRAWNFTLDGIDNNDPSAGGSNFAPTRANPDTLAEFRVITSNPTAEYGRNSGAQVAMITRSGSNDFHGNAFEFYQTPRFHANEFANNLNKAVKPQFVQHIAGFSVGGPVWVPKVYDGRNKTFFFTNFQWLRTRQTVTVTRTVYTQLARQGIFRYVKGGQNGAAGTATPSVDANGNVLPGLNIGTYNIAANDPAGKGLDPTIAALIGFTLLPNNFTAGDGLNTAGYTFSPIQREQQRDAVVKIDHVFNAHHSVYARYAQGHQNTIGDNVNGGLARFPDTPRIVDTFRTPKNLATNWRWNPSSHVTNEFVFGISRFAFNFANPDPSFPDVPPFILNDVTDPFNAELGNLRRFATYQFVDNATYVRGAHTFKAGINFRYQQHVDTRGSVAGLNVQQLLNFSTTINTVDLTAFKVPTDINTANDRPRLQRTINNLLARIGSISQGFVAAGDQYASPGTPFNFDARYGEYDFYGQDNWKIRPNLTVDLGLRWEVKKSPRSSGNPILRPEEPFVVGSAPSDALKWNEGELFHSDLNNFGPSIGIAWDPFSTGKTSVRANYRIAYDRMNTFVVSSTIYQSEPGLTLGVINTQFGQNGGRLRDGLPAIAPPAGLTPTQLRQPASFSTNTFHVIDPDWQAPKTYQWSLSVQREIGWNTLVELNYIGRRGENLFGAYNVNQAEIFSNGFLEGFKIVKAGGESALINQLMQPDTSRRTGETGSQEVRRLFPTQLSQNSVAELAAALGRRTGAGGRPIPELSGLGKFFFFPYPQFAGGLNILDSHDKSTYHAFEAQLQKRFSGGLSFQVSYTLAKSLDTRSFDPAFTTVSTGANQQASSSPFDARNRDLNYARSDFDRRHSFQGGAVYDLPFGAGRRWASDVHPVIEKVIGGWALTGSAVQTSGRPFTIYAGSNTFSSVVQSPANCNGCTPDMIRRIFETAAGTEFYFNIATRGAAFDAATNTRGIFSVPAPGELGNTGRNFFTMPGFFNLNLSIGKRTRITENQNLEYRLEMQNATNTPSFGLPESAVITSTLFGRARGNTVSGSRKIQMALKYNF
ncbi:MAG: TonB-dependent receptor [Acidobacteriota bacterium]